MTRNPDTFIKGEAELLDYQIDMSAELASVGDALTSVAWSLQNSSGISPDLTVASSSFTSTTATVWLAGGVHGQKYQVLGLMRTVNGRIYDRFFALNVA